MGARGASRKSRRRTAKSVDRSKGLLVLAVAVIIMIFVFLGMFSSSSGTKDRAANRTKPSLGRPEIAATGAAENRGSVTPLLNADMSGQEGNSDQVSADDVKATGRLRMRPQPQPGEYARQYPAHGSGSGGVSPGEGRLPGSAASASGRKRSGSSATAAPAHNEADALKKSSLVFVRNNSGASANVIRPASMTTEPALLERKATGSAPEWQPPRGTAAIRRQHGGQGARGRRHRIQL